MKKYFCIHGHFYQPPRENPGLEEVELQDSAYPFHDWNERVTAECYASNASARIQDGGGKIFKIVNNYQNMSFDFGPTLLIWLERHRKDVYEKILDADRISCHEHHGHGNAVAQIYNHIIMPLAPRHDKETEVAWGIRDFEYRFRRKPEGMWLSETAVDEETLEVLAEQGILFTILSPYQASRVRPIGEKEWIDVSGARVDPTQAYRCFLKSGKYIDLFFYDGPISFSIAFDDSLWNGEALVQKIMGGYSHERPSAQLVNVATDGESYGHHRKFGDMTLAYALHKLQENPDVQLTNYAEFLELYPPVSEAEIFEATAWSCAHGVGRWKEDCSCRLNQGAGWNQKWRKPLREAMDWLKAKADDFFISESSGLLKEPWHARNDYIDVIYHQSEAARNRFFAAHARNDLTQDEKVKLLKLLEIQRNGLLMFTSCGWFFDDVSGLEATQILHYADRVLQLMQEMGQNQADGFIERLSKAKSNIPEWGYADEVYSQAVEPSRVTFERMATQWMLSHLFSDETQKNQIYCFDCESLSEEKTVRGPVSLFFAGLKLSSQITLESKNLGCLLFHAGGPDFHCVIRPLEEFEQEAFFKKGLFEKLNAGLASEIPQLIAERYGEVSFTLKDIFLDERRKILSLVTTENSAVLERALRSFYNANQVMMKSFIEEDIALPKGYSLVLEYLLSRDLQRAADHIQTKEFFEEIQEVLDEAEYWNIELDLAGVRKNLENSLSAHFHNENYKDCLDLLEFSKKAHLELSVWDIQNKVYECIVKNRIPKSEDGVLFHRLAAALGFHEAVFQQAVLAETASRL